MKLSGLTLTAFASLITVSCASTDQDFNDPELNTERQAFLDSINGLKTINGLSTTNGLKTMNGLSTTNGLKTLNGLTTINGLATMNGLKTMNGLTTTSGAAMPVNCPTSGKVGSDCTGTPDGLMSAETGLMSSDLGIMTAKYLTRCALPGTDFLRIKDYTGALVTLPGEVGLTPSWKNGDCDDTCQEKVSACLLSYVNNAGIHVQFEMDSAMKNADGITGTADDNVLTIGLHDPKSLVYQWQENAFYGNAFTDPPQVYYATSSQNSLQGIQALNTRICDAFNLLGFSCPYTRVGSVGPNLVNDGNKCTEVGGTPNANVLLYRPGTAVTCKDKNNKVWNNPVTSYVKLLGTN